MDKLYNAISLCRRAGKLAGGFDAVCESAQSGAAFLVLLASDVSERTARNVKASCEGLCPVKPIPHTQAGLAPITRKRVGVLAVTDKDLAVLCQKAMPDEEEPV